MGKEKEYTYKGKKEVKKVFSIGILESVMDKVKEHLGEYGSVSPLIQNLLINWCWTMEKNQKEIGELLSKRDLGEVEKELENIKQYTKNDYLKLSKKKTPVKDSKSS